MQPLEDRTAEPLPISDRTFDMYAGMGYPTSEREDGLRVVHVPTPIYEAQRKAKRRSKERNRRRERAAQRRR